MERDLNGSASDQGGVGVVERSWRQACAGDVALHTATDNVAEGSGGGESTISLTPGLNWGVLPADGEGMLPAASLTWVGHGVVTGSAVGSLGSTGSDTAAPTAVSAEQDISASPMGAALVAVLADVEVADAGDGELVDVAARWQEVISWATAMQSRAAGEIARRRGWTEEHTTAAAEVSARLRVPQTDANKLMARGSGLAEHPQVMDALHQAQIDVAKADILLRSGNPLTVEERDRAITLYLPQAPDRTRRWLRDKMNQYATRLHGTAEVVRQAMTRRAVYLDPADNSMAWISANLPATDAAAVWDAIDTAAHVIRRTPGTTRTLAQARADAFVAITTGRVVVPPRAECAPEAAAPDPGAGPAESVLPRTTMPATGCTCGGCTCDGTSIRVVAVKPQVRVTVPATMLLGLDDSPGHLDGYGPIPADQAARIATDATWQRMLTDPVTGILTDYSTTSYQPGKVLRQAVTARDQTCCFPQCDRPAHRADLDHIQPYDHAPDRTSQESGAPGQTRAGNLQPLCRAHHLAKTHDGWDVTRDPRTGTTTWTAPTGHIYNRPPAQAGRAMADAKAAALDAPGPTEADVTSLTDDVRHLLGNREQPAQGRSAHSPADRAAGPNPPNVSDEPPF
ncbi:HNH endonuclease [Promicromonospora kroppenstedtii]|uniref:HNH endonuclease n=1 Tax=Promicromonospora kroppenstedtii TaxID=440482 RepID=A0ABW7XJ05_9MICO